jgi:hypothetical protein
VSGVICKARILRRFENIKHFIGDCRNREEMRRKVALENLKAEYSSGRGAEGTGKSSAFSFEFNGKMAGSLKFPYQYGNEAVGKDFKFEIAVRNGFEDWELRDEIPRSDLEEMSYKSKESFQNKK